jgi:hypothetical protein
MLCSLKTQIPCGNDKKKNKGAARLHGIPYNKPNSVITAIGYRLRFLSVVFWRIKFADQGSLIMSLRVIGVIAAGINIFAPVAYVVLAIWGIRVLSSIRDELRRLNPH